ncbi:hypothetical protein K7472_04970 [Streptomyces sp. PTM05]|uniref:Integral membrane protein n=1 Tax=Streptantibioticus parmotrematis TaxID=2873249 RepID=A0ABS7QLY5_9ACTN|nr:hypothetical protein [Streptantibioticus parmotrematis]MBY8884197.1 hypothetical protein [Streptantibioticus parmotrematis]
MAWESLVSALIGLAVAWTAVHRLPDRFRDHRLTLATGPAAALVGGGLTSWIVGPTPPLFPLAAALLVSTALLSLLLKPHHLTLSQARRS